MMDRIRRHVRYFLFRFYSAFYSIRPILNEYFRLIWRCLFSRPIILCGAGGLIGILLGMKCPIVPGMIMSFFITVVIISGFYSGRSYVEDKSVDAIKSLRNDKRRDDYTTSHITTYLTVIVMIMLMLFSFFYLSLNRERSLDFLKNANQDVAFDRSYHGYIVGAPYGKSNEEYQTFVLRTDEGVRISFYSSLENLGYGKYTEITGRLTTHSGPRNPGGFDYKTYYSNKGIYLKLITSDDKISINEDRSKVPGLLRRTAEFFYHFRIGLIRVWEKVLPKEDAAVLGAMILGEKSALSEETRNRFRVANLSHLIAVSGMHVSCFLVPVASFVRLSGRRLIRQIGTVMFLVLFGFLTDWTPSVSRAVIMSVYAVISSLFRRRNDALTGLFASSMILLFLDPFIISDTGFRLSFGAAFAMIKWSGRLTGSMARFIPKEIARPVAGMLSAQIGVLPIMIGLTSKQSPLLMTGAIVGTLLSQSICVLVIPLTVLHLFSSLIAPANELFKIIYLPIRGLEFLLEQASRIGESDRYNAIALDSVALPLLLGGCCLIIVFTLRRSTARRFISAVTAFLIITGAISQGITYLDRPLATVVFFDVGQGDSALIMSDDKSVLIDGGEEKQCGSVLIPALEYYGIRKVDVTLLTHLHSDHGGGLMELMDSGRLSRIGVSFDGFGDNYEKLVKDHEADGIFYRLKKGDQISISKDVDLFVLHPEIAENEGGNEDSLVIFVDFGECGMLFLGDSGFLTEDKLLHEEQNRSMFFENTDIIKVGHHGSKFSSADTFLSEVSPQVAVISVGANFYGHPTEEAILRLQEAETDIFRTDRDGAIIIRIYDNRISIQTMQGSGDPL